MYIQEKKKKGLLFHSIVILLILFSVIGKNDETDKPISCAFITNNNDYYIEDNKLLKNVGVPVFYSREEKNEYYTKLFNNNEFEKILDEQIVGFCYGNYYEAYSSNYHLGTDYKGVGGEAVYAPSNSYVFFSNGSYKKIGYIGCKTDIGLKDGGNQVLLLTEVNNIVYGLIFLHLQDVYVTSNSFIPTGEIIGTIGQTGSSNAPHLHVELYALGQGHLSDYINNDYDYSFNVPRDFYCDDSDYPYRMNPELFWN